MEQIRELFLEFICSEAYIRAKTPDVILEAEEKVRAAYGEISDEVVALAVEYEERGFINGFRLAMRIAMDCAPDKFSYLIKKSKGRIQ